MKNTICAGIGVAYPQARIFLCTLNVFKRVNYSHFPTNNGINTLLQYNTHPNAAGLGAMGRKAVADLTAQLF